MVAHSIIDHTGLTGVGAAAFSGVGVYLATTNQAIVSATVVAIAFNAEEWDTDTYHDNATNNSRISVPTTAKYRVEGVVSFQDVDATDRHVRLHKNGAFFRMLWEVGTGTTALHTLSFSTTVNLTAADYLEIAVYQASGAFTVVAGVAYTAVQVTRIG